MRMILLFIAVVATEALGHTQNTIFKKTNGVTLIRSKWKITFIIDLKAYELLLK